MKSKSISSPDLTSFGTADDLPEWIKNAPGFHRQIKAVRELRGISQQRLADSSGLTWRSIPNIESGRIHPRIQTLEKIADVLGCDLKIILIPKSPLRHMKASPSPAPPAPEQTETGKSPVRKKTEHEDEIEKKKEYFWD